MIQEIRIYVEGGGSDTNTKARFRQSMGRFLDELRQKARERRIGWQVIACGSRSDAFRDFRNAHISHPNAMNFLLVDSEGPVHMGVRDHLYNRAGDGWDLGDYEDDQLHMMIQMMESWFLADREALQQYYGAGFKIGALPNNPHVEQIPKQDVQRSLRQATRETTKREYHKTRHGPDLLERISPSKVRDAAPACERLFITLKRSISGL
ncbi:MAG: DUF4276 family protein [Longimicrobiaceae bacterium]